MGEMLRGWCLWARTTLKKTFIPLTCDYRDNKIDASRIPLLAAVGGSMVTRHASRRAFLREQRALVTQDILPEIGKAFTEVLE
jgi:NAD(P)H-hydrate repair Nnr-like enzyme with NAD(P)H-hydrate dehydratase domain